MAYVRTKNILELIEDDGSISKLDEVPYYVDPNRYVNVRMVKRKVIITIKDNKPNVEASTEDDSNIPSVSNNKSNTISDIELLDCNEPDMYLTVLDNEYKEIEYAGSKT